MSKFIFTKKSDISDYPIVVTTIEVEAEKLSDVVESFVDFLLGCGYARETIESYFGDNDKYEDL
jgi:hypothetical protein